MTPTGWIGLARLKVTSANISFQLERLGAIGADDEPVGQPFADKRSNEGIERQGAGDELLLLQWGERWHHEAVTDIHTELVTRAATRCRHISEPDNKRTFRNLGWGDRACTSAVPGSRL